MFHGKAHWADKGSYDQQTCLAIHPPAHMQMRHLRAFFQTYRFGSYFAPFMQTVFALRFITL